MTYCDFEGEVVRDVHVSNMEIDEQLANGVQTGKARPDITITASTKNLFENADQQPITESIFQDSRFSSTPLLVAEANPVGIRIQGRSKWNRLNGLTIQDSPKQKKKKMSATQKANNKFNTWYKEYTDIIKQRDALTRKAEDFLDQVVLETVKYCHHLFQQPTTKKSLSTYQFDRANVLKSILHDQFPLYDVAMKAVRRADSWTRNASLEE
ncbi:hypothetical protein EDC96DRAFT_581197 [Choanephora cucurbitarum]|nr:hypothetical protein EDC96DRAFT_581197 [Choanephora cucurbitarum]